MAGHVWQMGRHDSERQGIMGLFGFGQRKAELARKASLTKAIREGNTPVLSNRADRRLAARVMPTDVPTNSKASYTFGESPR